MSPALLYHGDCLDEMRRIPDGSVDMILDDLPYAVTNSKSEAGQWDNLIPFEPMWEQFLRVTKEDAAIILFAQGMFTARLMLSQPSIYRYSLIWDKCRSTGFLNASKMPLRRHEDILVFYRKQPSRYNPQLILCDPSDRTHSRGNLKNRQTNRVYGEYKDVPTKDPDHKYPGSILKFPRPHATGNHPTEKSVDLCRWLIRSYTNKGDTVLDATAGSGTTGVAAVLEDRKFVGIEKEQKYFEVMQRRIDEAINTPRQESFL